MLLPLLLLAALLGACALAALVYAVVTAKDGSETAEGFEVTEPVRHRAAAIFGENGHHTSHATADF